MKDFLRYSTKELLKVGKKALMENYSKKIFLETIKRIDSDKVYSPWARRFVEIFPDGIVRGCEVEKLWDISEIGSVNNTNLDIVDVVNSKKAKDFQKVAKIAHAHLNVPMLLTLFMIPSIGSHYCKVEKF